jgi:type VI secretion system secreted protein VgrG
LSLKVGGNFVHIGPAGVAIQGTVVMINSGGAAGSGSGSSPTAPQAPAAPEDAKVAKPIKPTLADDSKSGFKSAPMPVNRYP